MNAEFNFSLKPDYLLMDNSDFSFKKFLKKEKLPKIFQIIENIRILRERKCIWKSLNNFHTISEKDVTLNKNVKKF